MTHGPYNVKKKSNLASSIHRPSSQPLSPCAILMLPYHLLAYNYRQHSNILTPGEPFSYLFVLYLMMLAIGEMEKTWMEAAVTYYEMLFRCLASRG